MSTSDSDQKISEYEALLAQEPGNAAFVEFSDYLRRSGKPQEALRVALAGVSANPTEIRGRLVLARLFYEAGFGSFAIRELEELNRAEPGLRYVKKLLMRLAPDRVTEADAGSSPTGEVAAEAEVDIDLFEQ